MLFLFIYTFLDKASGCAEDEEPKKVRSLYSKPVAKAYKRRCSNVDNLNEWLFSLRKVLKDLKWKKAFVPEDHCKTGSFQ